jgi:uncharacterized membrane protein YhfC
VGVAGNGRFVPNEFLPQFQIHNDNMITLLLVLNGVLMIVLPVLLGWQIAVRRGASWVYFGMGAVTFVGSQVLHIPFNWLVLQKWDLLPSGYSETADLIILALFLGFSAGVFEEVARYVTYRFWATDARSWGRGLMLGAGHGGIEAILLGVLVLVNSTVLVGLSRGYFWGLIPTEQAPLVTEQLTAVGALPWYMMLLGAVERVFALCLHLACSILVLQLFVRGGVRWLVLAIVWHAAVDATAVYAIQTWGAVPTEVLIGLFALVSVGIVFALRTPEPVAAEPEPLPALAPVALDNLPVTTTHLDDSRYT